MNVTTMAPAAPASAASKLVLVTLNPTISHKMPNTTAPTMPASASSQPLWPERINLPDSQPMSGPTANHHTKFSIFGLYVARRFRQRRTAALRCRRRTSARQDITRICEPSIGCQCLGAKQEPGHDGSYAGRHQEEPNLRESFAAHQQCRAKAARGVHAGPVDVNSKEVDRGQREADDESREACWSGLLRGAENDNQEDHRGHDFIDKC